MMMFFLMPMMAFDGGLASGGAAAGACVSIAIGEDGVVMP